MASVEKRFLDLLKSKQAEYAREALTRPTGRDAFAYGEATGVYKGLLIAEQLLTETLDEERDRT